MRSKEVIVILSHLPWDFPTDFIRNTAIELNKKARVVIFSPINLPTIRQLILEKNGNWQPGEVNINYFPSLGVIPFQRIELIKNINLYLNFFLFRLYYLLKFGRQRPIFWIFNFSLEQILPLLDWGKLIVYDRVDHTGSIDKKDDRIRREQDVHLLEKADFVFTNSPYALNYVKRYNKKSFLVPCGCLIKLFDQKNIQPSKELQKIKKPLIGLVGSLDHRLDYKLLYKLIKKRQDWSFVFVGGPFSNEISQFKIAGLAGRLSELKKLSNVHFLKQQKKEKLPSFVAGFDVCLIPYDISQESVRGCNPMKLYEYLSLGKPVVSTPIEAIKVYEPKVRIASDAKEFEKEIEKNLHYIDNQEEILKRQKIARENSWERKIGEMGEMTTLLF